MSGLTRRLLEIVHADQKLYLVFEFLDMDLKRYIDHGNQNGTPITLDIVKVNTSLLGFSPRNLETAGGRLSLGAPDGRIRNDPGSGNGVPLE